MKIYVIGHVSPDLDAISSAYEYAEYLHKSKRFEGSEIIAARAGEPNNETKVIFEKFGAELPILMDDVEVEETDAFVLVDHNEESQRHSKVVNEQVIEIVDHHKISINFTSPLRIDVRPLGSTSSIVYELFNMYGIKASEESLGLILCSILSDTQGLKASTTTGYDSEIAKEIAKNLKLDLDKLTFEIFKAKSDLTGLTVEEIVQKDYKVFDFNGKKVFIDQVETVEPEKVLEMKEDIVSTLDSVKSKLGVGMGFVVITDILKINSQVIYTNDEEKEIIEKAFTTNGSNNIADIGPRMSRKKDIAPEIEKTLL